MNLDPIVKTLNLPCAAAHAFDVFVARIATWWPLDGHVASAKFGKPALAVTIEPRVGGAVYETMYDGSRDEWGEVLEYEAGRKIAFTWHPGNNAENPTRVEVVFEDVAQGQSRLTLTHSGWEVWATAADERRGGYDKGWDFVLGTHFLPACG